MNLRNVKYERIENGKIIYVDTTKLLDRLEHDDPKYSMRDYKGGQPKNQICSRTEKAKQWILKNYNNPKAIFEPSIVGIYRWNKNDIGKISFKDGRHRVFAAELLGIPEVAIEIPSNQEREFEYMKVDSISESKLYETPDKIKGGELWDYLYMSSGQALPFECLIINGKLKVFVGEWGGSHYTVRHDDNDDSLIDVNFKKFNQIKNNQIKYSGRLWVGEKIISFWTYPNKKDFNEIINQLETHLLVKIKTAKPPINISNKIWNNGWQVEIFLFKNEFNIDKNYLYFLSKKNGAENITTKLIPVEDYMESEDSPDELRKIHLMNSAEKDMLRKSGNDPLKYYKSLGKNKNVEPIDILKNRQLMYQENITKFDNFYEYKTTNHLINYQKWLLHEGLWAIPYEKMSDVKYITDVDKIQKGYGEYPEDEKISNIVNKIKNNQPLEPIVLGSDYMIYDGNHRFEAIKQLNIKRIPVIFIISKSNKTNENSSYEDVKSKYKKDILYPLKREALKFDNFKDFSHSYSVFGNHGLYFHLTKDPNFTYNPKIGSRDMSSMASGESSEKGSFMVTSSFEHWDYYYNFDEDENPRTSGTRDYVAIVDLGDCKYHIGFGRGFGHEIYLYPSEAKKAIILDVISINDARKLYKKFRSKMPESEESLYKIWKDVHNLTESFITRFKDFENNI